MRVDRETARIIQALKLPRYMIGVIPKTLSSLIAGNLGLADNLKILEMMSVPLSQANLDFLCNVVVTSTTLEQLHLSCCWHEGGSLFSRLSKKYKSLAKAIGSSESLQILRISRTVMVYEGFLADLFAGSAHKLKKLILSRSIIESPSILAVQNALEHPECQIQHLNLSGIPQGSDITPIANALEVNTSLKEFLLSSRYHLPDDSAEALANALRVNSTLESIKMCDVDIGAENNTFSTEGWKSFSKGLKESQGIHYLDISGNDFVVRGVLNLFRATGIQYLLDGLEENQSVTHFTMQDISADPHSFDLIGDFIQTRNFKLLNISNISNSEYMFRSYKGLPDRFLWSVAHRVASNGGMEVLKIANIRMEGPNGLKTIIRALANNTTLRELDISENREDHLLRELADALTSNQHLLKLNLKDIALATDDFQYFAKCLPKMKGLESIVFGELNDTFADALLSGLKDNDTLKHMDGPFGDGSCWRKIDFYLRWNRGGRKILKMAPPSVLLPKILSRSRNGPDVLFEILRGIQLHA
ncbi:unnamed protein product [Cylindrotheca closterium]|uniref:Uncharacterized protein n=1 Tax=Cylindrotheca closterium TaxID=2856 RepID=A0AAD2JNF8_9STRA|nr:unnamed protein product [Cylindrotheca closterium]